MLQERGEKRESTCSESEVAPSTSQADVPPSLILTQCASEDEIVGTSHWKTLPVLLPCWTHTLQTGAH